MVTRRNLKILGNSFYNELFARSVELCSAIPAINDIRTAIDICLHLDDAKEYCNFNALSIDTAEYNAMAGMLHILGRDSFALFLGAITKKALHVELDDAGVDSNAYRIEFIGNETVCSILNKEFSNCGVVLSENDVSGLITVKIPVTWDENLPEYLVDALAMHGQDCFVEAITGTLSECMQLMEDDLQKLVEQEIARFGGDKNNRLEKAVAVLRVAEELGSTYFMLRKFDRFWNCFLSPMFKTCIADELVSFSEKGSLKPPN